MALRILQLLLAAQPAYGTTTIFSTNLSSPFSTSTALPLSTAAPTAVSARAEYADPFLSAPELARDRTLEHAIALCKSPDFALTAENWHESQAEAFLQEFTSLPSFDGAGRGVVDELAFQYLGKHIQCSAPGGMCRIDCTQVVSSINDIETARRVYFVMMAAKNLAQVYESISQNLIAAQSNVGLWAPKMAATFFWASKNHYELQREALVNFFNAFVMNFFTIAVDLLSFSNILSYAESAEEALFSRVQTAKALHDAATSVQEQAKLAHKLVALEKRLKGATKRAATMREIARDSIPFTSKRIYTHALLPLSSFALAQSGGPFIAMEKDERSPTMNAANLQIQIQSIAEQFRKYVKQSAQHILSGADATASGVSSLSQLLSAGGLLVPNAALTFWSSLEAESSLTKAIALHTVAAAWKAQPMWITCTTSFRAPDPRRNSFSRATTPVASCEVDRSGPQDMKACVDGRACYLYKWNSRGHAHAHAVERPFGWHAAAEHPWSFKISNVIESSVKSHLGVQPARDLTEFWNPAAPGVWSIPVCESEYNWNGPVEPVSSIWCDTDPKCAKKALPCYCGPLGRDTRELWEKTGLWETGAALREYRKLLCPRRIRERMSDPIERYVALCRLDVRRFGLIQLQGGHSMCGAVIEALEEMGVSSVGDVEGRNRSKLLCLSGLAKDKRMCKALRT